MEWEKQCELQHLMFDGHTVNPLDTKHNTLKYGQKQWARNMTIELHLVSMIFCISFLVNREAFIVRVSRLR